MKHMMQMREDIVLSSVSVFGAGIRGITHERSSRQKGKRCRLRKGIPQAQSRGLRDLLRQGSLRGVLPLRTHVLLRCLCPCVVQ